MRTDLPLRRILALTLAGVVLRLIFLGLAGHLEPYADESNYIYLALGLIRFGVLSDGGSYLWPPGYPWLISLFLLLFGIDGLVALKVVQVAASAAVGVVTMLLAGRLAGARAMTVGGALWAIYLPLIGYTHYLWPETFFLALYLPALYLTMRSLDAGVGPGTRNALVLASGALLGTAALFKEIALYVGLLLAVLLLIRQPASRLGGRLPAAAIFILAAMAVVTPWTLRNASVYGRFVPVGATLGKNLYMGLNGSYRNLEYPREIRKEAYEAGRPINRVVVGKPRPPWDRSEARNVIDRSRENVRRALEFAAANPGYAARSRVMKLADLLTPASFFVRHFALGRYRGLLASTPVRRGAIVVALALTVLVLGAAIPGFLMGAGNANDRVILGTTVACFILASVLTSSMSRYRVPIEPLLIALSSCTLAGGHVKRPRGASLRIALWGVAALVSLWMVDAGPVMTLLKHAW